MCTRRRKPLPSSSNSKLQRVRIFLCVYVFKSDSLCGLLTMCGCFAEAAADAAENLNQATRRVDDLEKRLKAAELREESAIGRLSAASTSLTGMNFCYVPFEVPDIWC